MNCCAQRPGGVGAGRLGRKGGAGHGEARHGAGEAHEVQHEEIVQEAEEEDLAAAAGDPVWGAHGRQRISPPPVHIYVQGSAADMEVGGGVS